MDHCVPGRGGCLGPVSIAGTARRNHQAVASSGGSFASWLTVLDKLVPLQPRVVVPTHSKVGDASLIASEAAFIRDMQGRAAALKRSGVSAAEAVTRLIEVFRSSYPEWVINPDWPNVNSMTGFVNRLYSEIRE